MSNIMDDPISIAYECPEMMDAVIQIEANLSKTKTTWYMISVALGRLKYFRDEHTLHLHLAGLKTVQTTIV